MDRKLEGKWGFFYPGVLNKILYEYTRKKKDMFPGNYNYFYKSDAYTL